MSTLAWKKRAIAAAIGAMTVTAAGSAGAGGFAITTQNASGLGLANSGQAAAAEDASTIWYNPAGVTNLPGRQVVGALNVINTSVKFQNNGTSTTPNGVTLSTLGNGGDAGGWAAVPSAYLSWQLNPQLWLGVGLGAPFGLKTEYDDPWVGQFHGIKSEIKTINVNPTIAWKINDTVSLGFGLNAQYLDAEITSRAPSPGFPLIEITGDDWGWGWNVGAMFTVSPATRIGVSYRSEIEYTIEGDVKANGAFTGASRAEIKLPDMFSIALSQQLGPQWQILADYTWTGWDSIQNLSIFRNGAPFTSTPLQFKNSWRVGVGVNYQLNNEWKLRFGTAYDKTPVQDAFRTPRLPDEDRIWLAVGAQWRFSKQGALDFGYAHEFVDDASSNLPNVDTVPAGFTATPKGALRGTYKANVNIFGVQLKYSF